MAKIGVIACDMIRRELEPLLSGRTDVEKVVWLESALHVYPQKMKETILAEIRRMAAGVDAIFLGYGFCQSLRGIEEEVEVPVHLPAYDDCISMLLTPRRYAEEVRKEVGTWFMTPGWAEIGAELVIKELRLERVRKYGKDPLEMAKRLLTHYRRGLYVETGSEEDENAVAQAEQFCLDFSLRLEKTRGDVTLLAKELEKVSRALSAGETVTPPTKPPRA